MEKFAHPSGDHLSYLNVIYGFQASMNIITLRLVPKPGNPMFQWDIFLIVQKVHI